MRLTGFSLKAALVGLLLVVPAKSAQEAVRGSTDVGAVIGFDIPAQPLERALLTYSRIANVQVLYDAALVQAQHSSPVQGSYRATEALELLLRGTGLRVRYATAEAITLTAISTGGGEGVLHVQAMRIQGSPEALDRRRMASYAQTVEAQILEALRRDPSTSHIPFDVKMNVWLDTDRRIARADMVASDVGEKADVAILSVVRSATLSDPPPGDLPQPLSFRFRSRPAF
jgi:hypothetical protein